MSSQLININSPKNQLELFGYNRIFHSFIDLYNKKLLPNALLLSGPPGSGKSTFAYHFINYLLSKNEENFYSKDTFEINPDNTSYKLVQNKIHPNLFVVEKKENDEIIKIDQIRDLLNFLNKTSYSNNIKIVLINNVEYLNANSSNALLKSLEEPSDNTFFIILHNSFSKIIDTIKSRCIEFKITFTIEKKKEIFNSLIKKYDLDFNNTDFNSFFYFDSPGNVLNYLVNFHESNIKITETPSCIDFLINKYITTKDPYFLDFISVFIEKFYNNMSLSNIKNINTYFKNKNKILNLINDMKKFNLDKKNLIFTINKILNNEV